VSRGVLRCAADLADPWGQVRSGRRPLRHQPFERQPIALQRRHLSGPILPALDDDIDITRIQLQQPRLPPGLLCRSAPKCNSFRSRTGTPCQRRSGLLFKALAAPRRCHRSTPTRGRSVRRSTHTNPLTTKRYAHLADDSLRAAAERFGSKVTALPDRREAEIVPLGVEVAGAQKALGSAAYRSTARPVDVAGSLS